MAESEIKGVLFDKDGTLFDFYASWGKWTKNYVVDQAPNDVEKQKTVASAIGFDLENGTFAPDSMVIAGTPDEIVDLLLPFFPSESREDLQASILNSSAEAEMVEATPLHPLLRELLAGGIRLGVATNDSEEPAMAHLRSAGIENYFEYIVGFDSGYGAKPAPGMCTGFCQKTGLHPSNVAMVGDSIHDLTAGRAAGMYTVAVLTGVATEEELRPFADVVLSNIGGLPAWIENCELRTKEFTA